MKNKRQLPDIYTPIIGPSCCGKFSAARELCNQCIAQGLYSHAICFVRPTVAKGTGYEQQQEQLAEIAKIAGGGPP